MSETIPATAAKKTVETYYVIKTATLNFIEKWRKMREANDYAMKFYKPKLIVR